MLLTRTNRHLQATQTTSLDLKEQWVVNIVNFIRHHLKDVKKGWFNLDEVRGVKRCDKMFYCASPTASSKFPEVFVCKGVPLGGDETTWESKRDARGRGPVDQRQTMSYCAGAATLRVLALAVPTRGMWEAWSRGRPLPVVWK